MNLLKIKKTDRILIVGGIGFIGRCLAGKCLRHSPAVTVIGLPGRSGIPAGKKIKFIAADITDKKELQAAIENNAFEYVFNCGGYIDHTPYMQGGRELIDSHFAGMMNVIDCIDRKVLKKFVQIGSSDEYGNAPAPQKETYREMPVSPYSLAKTAATHFIQMLSLTEGFPGTVVRFFLVYGPGQNEKRFLPQIITACLKNKEFKTSQGSQLRDFCYVDDAVEALVCAALTKDAIGKVINIGSGVPVSIKKMIGEVISLIGCGKPLWGGIPYRKGENMELYADIRLARKILGWEPSTGLDAGLQKTIDYYKNKNNNRRKEGTE